MLQGTQQNLGPVSGLTLYVAEFVHRINNEYTSAISFASVAAARTPNTETQAALQAVIERLHALAAVHRVLRPSLSEDHADLTDHISQLCRAMGLAGLADRSISVNLVVPGPILLQRSRCWRLGLIIAELITNASRHAYTSHGGKIEVALILTPDKVACRVSDEGSSPMPFKSGVGTQLVNLLADDLHARIERWPGSRGTTVEVSFQR